jgi:TRAP-type uncharacterized transport system substrate-binding protein
LRLHPVCLCACAWALLFCGTAAAQSPDADAHNIALAQTQPATALTEGEAENVLRANNWTIGIVGGMIEDAPTRFAADLQIALDDGDELRILPIVSRGVKQNVLDLLYLKGVDAGVLYTDAFDEFRRGGKIKNIDNRINYISQLFLSGVHILVRPEIKSLKDLEGKKFGFDGRGTGVSVTSALIFERMGVKVEPVYVTNNQALEKMKTGELHGLIYLVSKAHPTVTSIDAELGFHLLSIPYEKFTDYYVPTTYVSADYPNLIEPGDKVETISVPAVLAVYNWPKGTDRFRKLERFIRYYFERFDTLKSPPFQKDWKEINLAAKVPGWNRYWFAEQMVARMRANARSSTGSLASSAEKTTPPGPPDAGLQKRFNDFMEWKQQQQNQ